MNFWDEPEIKSIVDKPPFLHEYSGSCRECNRLEALAMKEAHSNTGGYYNYLFNLISKAHHSAIEREKRKNGASQS